MSDPREVALALYSRCVYAHMEPTVCFCAKRLPVKLKRDEDVLNLFCILQDIGGSCVWSKVIVIVGLEFDAIFGISDDTFIKLSELLLWCPGSRVPRYGLQEKIILSGKKYPRCFKGGKYRNDPMHTVVVHGQHDPRLFCNNPPTTVFKTYCHRIRRACGVRNALWLNANTTVWVNPRCGTLRIVMNSAESAHVLREILRGEGIACELEQYMSTL